MITQQTSYSDIAAAHNQHTANLNTTAGNENISSMLSQIQDDGPAYADSNAGSQRSDGLINLRSDTGNVTSGQLQSEGLNNNEQQPDLSAVYKQNRVRVASDRKAASGLNKNKTTWMQISLILFIALAVTFFLFRLDTRTDQLEASLNSYSDDMLDSIDSYNSELSPGLRSIKKTLKTVKQELELIKANTVSESIIENPVAGKPLVNSHIQQPSINDNIGIMDDEILALKNELKIAKDKLKAISANKKATTAIATTGWVVSLASFTTKSKADKVLEPLYAAGLSPLIQEANVNGQRIYRLIIDGFASQADAKLFVHRADNEFSLPGAWVRKS